MAQKRVKATLLLLTHGADPYLQDAGRSQGALDVGLEQGALGGAKGFWARLDALCLAKAPPAVEWAKLSCAERARRVVASW